MFCAGLIYRCADIEIVCLLFFSGRVFHLKSKHIHIRTQLRTHLHNHITILQIVATGSNSVANVFTRSGRINFCLFAHTHNIAKKSLILTQFCSWSKLYPQIEKYKAKKSDAYAFDDVDDVLSTVDNLLHEQLVNTGNLNLQNIVANEQATQDTDAKKA